MGNQKNKLDSFCLARYQWASAVFYRCRASFSGSLKDASTSTGTRNIRRFNRLRKPKTGLPSLRALHPKFCFKWSSNDQFFLTHSRNKKRLARQCKAFCCCIYWVQIACHKTIDLNHSEPASGFSYNHSTKHGIRLQVEFNEKLGKQRKTVPMDKAQVIKMIRSAKSETEIGLELLKYHLIKHFEQTETETAPPAPTQKKDYDGIIEAMLKSLPETAQYHEEEEKAFLAKKWVSVAEATEFYAGLKSEQTVRNMCSKRTLFSNIDERTSDKDAWMICPRSVALNINHLSDPRLEKGE